MKILQNKTTAIKEGGKALAYSNIIKLVCDQTPKGGWTTTIMRERIRIQDKVDKSNKSIELEDADATIVSVLVKNMTWALKHPDIVKFEDDVIAAFK